MIIVEGLNLLVLRKVVKRNILEVEFFHGADKILQ